MGIWGCIVAAYDSIENGKIRPRAILVTRIITVVVTVKISSLQEPYEGLAQ